MRYTAPLRVGDSIQAELVLTGLDREPSDRRGWVFFRAVLTNQDGVPVIQGDWRTIMLRRRS